jgi:hypothetical protein
MNSSLCIYIPSTVKYIAPDAFKSLESSSDRHFDIYIDDTSAKEDATPVRNVKQSNLNSTEVARFNVSGQKLNSPEKGINIVQMSDRTAKKELVK